MTGAGSRPRRLTDAFDPRANSVNALRLVLAALVLLSHALKLQGGVGPIGRITSSDVDLGTMAVDGFFALSGFLVVGSYLASPSTGRYLWRRCLRILPGFWVCLVVTAVVLLALGQLLEFGTLRGFPVTGDLSATSYVVDNAGLLIRQFEVRGLFGGQPVNGSLYTLFFEFVCYLGVAVLGVVGLLRTRRGLPVVAALAWLLAGVDWVLGGALTSRSSLLDIGLRFGLMFLAGALAARYPHRVPMDRRGGVLAVLVLVAAVGVAGLVPAADATLAYRVLAPPAVAYLVLLAGSSPRLRRVGARRDLSYGLYVYAWPVEVLYVLVGAGRWPLALYALAALGTALVLAWASWTVVEAPALRLKSWTPGRARGAGLPGHDRGTPASLPSGDGPGAD